jgi:hypothetical protein
LTAFILICIQCYIILHQIKNIAVVWLIFRVLAFASAQEANTASPGINVYNLFNPVPDDLMRELTPDRPHKTESPFTVDAGHYQLEMDFANYTYNESGGTATRAWNIAPFNIKAGLLDHVDLQFIFDNYLDVRTEGGAAGVTTTQSGVGDLTARLKINLWGDDGGSTAFALLPYVTFPTATAGLGGQGIAGGVIFPLAVKVPGGFDLGLETAFSCLHDDNDDNYHADFINSVTLDHDIFGKLSGYLEFFSDISTERHAGWVGTVDTGLEFLVAENVQLDCGCNFGVTQAADDYNPFAGITIRF